MIQRIAPERFGCTGCHEGQGVAVNSVNQAHGEVHLWEFPLLRGAKVQSSCTSCHLDAQKFNEDVPLLTEGQRLFEQVGCTGCHLVKGYESIPKIAAEPDEGSAPRSIRVGWSAGSKTRTSFGRARACPISSSKKTTPIAIASYIWSQSKEESDKWVQEHPLPAGIRDGDANEVAKGKKLVETIGCKGCHGFADGEFTTPLGKSKDLIPNLERRRPPKSRAPSGSITGSRIRAAINQIARMPSLRLADDEARAITTYLMTLGGKVGSATRDRGETRRCQQRQARRRSGAQVGLLWLS